MIDCNKFMIVIEFGSGDMVVDCWIDTIENARRSVFLLNMENVECEDEYTEKAKSLYLEGKIEEACDYMESLFCDNIGGRWECRPISEAPTTDSSWLKKMEK